MMNSLSFALACLIFLANAPFLVHTQDRGSSFELDINHMFMTERAAFLSYLVYDPSAARRYSRRRRGRRLYRAEPDVALTSRLGYYVSDDTELHHVCMVAFRGTDNGLWLRDRAKALKEWSQNLNGLDAKLKGECVASQGVFNAYNFTYRYEVEHDVHRCKRRCPDCEVVLTGHSQGGAIANVAAIFLSEHNPIVITFGQPPTLGKGCQDYIQNARWYRYNQAIPGGAGLKYDGIPSMLSWMEDLLGKEDGAIYGRFFGHEIDISSDDDLSVNYIGLDAHEDKFPYSITAHHMEDYLYTIQGLLDRMYRGYQVTTSGFSTGARCNDHDECASGSCRTYSWVPVVWRCRSY